MKSASMCVASHSAGCSGSKPALRAEASTARLVPSFGISTFPQADLQLDTMSKHTCWWSVAEASREIAGQVERNAYALVVSTENITLNWWAAIDSIQPESVAMPPATFMSQRSRLLCRCKHAHCRGAELRLLP